ncbi:HicA-like toxin [Gordonia phage Sour]|uniref:HicA-like toxin n=1 Tax=Gordonia phage Sour TaxID=2182349 RepID=A0A2U8UKW5_9CAUD|nr:HicA-like toxin [Gordonia phage Sour]AWN04272.1 HicA-like toxin [Gordonia phage Sour]
MARGMSKDVAKLVAEVEAAGAEVRRAKGQHLKVYLDGHLIGTIPSTPSDWRSLKNARSQLRRNGLGI